MAIVMVLGRVTFVSGLFYYFIMLSYNRVLGKSVKGYRVVVMASSELTYYCHSCQTRVEPITEDIICPDCGGGFVEKLEENTELNEPSVGNADSNPNNESQSQMNQMPLGMDLLFPRNDIAGNSPFPNFFTWISSNNRNAPSTSRSIETASTSHAPYNLRQRPQRAVGSNSAGVRRGTVPMEQVLIQDVVRRVFEGVDYPFIEFSLGDGGNFPPAFNFMEIHGNTGDYAWGPNGLDNIISQLLGQLENAGPPPASADAIRNLPTISISQEDVDKGRECSVCMDHFNLDEQAKRLPCSHCFHIPCIDPWLELHNTCPICRKVVEDVSCGSQASPNNTGTLNQSGQNTATPTMDSSNTSNSNADQNASFFSLFSNVFNPQSNNEDPR